MNVHKFIVQHVKNNGKRYNMKETKDALRWEDILHFALKGNPAPDIRVEKSNAEWQSVLSAEEFRITRLKGTEMAFSSDMCHAFEAGKYSCACCGELLFDAHAKFDSGTGWPSFTQPAKLNAVSYHLDNSYGMRRVETCCNTCGAHLGHVFPDGPDPEGLRYCINAISLRKIST
jgi:methionine-R-sulfoxide reductase